MTGNELWPVRLMASRRAAKLAQLLSKPHGEPAAMVVASELVANGTPAQAEQTGDVIVQWLQTMRPDDHRPEAARVAVGLANQAYLRGAQTCPERAAAFVAKGCSTLVWLNKFGEADEIATQYEDAVVTASLQALSLSDRSRLEQVQAMYRLATVAQHKNLELALCLLRWVHAQTGRVVVLDRFPEVVDPDDTVTTKAAVLRSACMERMTELEAGLGLGAAALDSIVAAAYNAAYSARQPTEARNLARRALVIGDRRVTELAGEERLGLLDHLATVSRLTRDVTEVAERFDRLCEQLRRLAKDAEREQDWSTAAMRYSALGYRCFAAAEYTSLNRLYLEAGFFFQKSEVLRARAPVDDDAAYRRWEGEGFASGASARTAGPAQAAGLFDAAATALQRAAVPVFQNTGLHIFYTSTAHFFAAHASLARVALTTDVREIVSLLAEAGTMFRECFNLMQQVFAVYAATLTELARGSPDPCSDAMATELTRTLHPHGERVAAAARDVAAALTAGDVRAIHPAVAELSAPLLYLNPLT
jgi:tetratricopeptide (TPR) repeat protein